MISRVLVAGLAVALILGVGPVLSHSSPSLDLLAASASAEQLAAEDSQQDESRIENSSVLMSEDYYSSIKRRGDDSDDDDRLSRQGSDDIVSGVKLRGDGSVDDDQPSVQGSDDIVSGVKLRGDGSVDDSQPSVQGSNDFSFKLGFKLLADQIPGIAGAPLENERYAANGDSLQQTTTGLMAWRKADNWTAFTDGATTWVNGPNGVQSRPNDVRFPWEAR